MSESYPHCILPPAKSFPKFHNQTGGELVYLGWGRRDYHVNPIPLHTNPGWSYYILQSGAARLLYGQEERVIKVNDAFVAGPECPYGFLPEGGAEVEVLTWIVNSAPVRLEPVMAADECRFFRFEQDELERLVELGKRTRSELFSGDALSNEALASVCSLVAIEFARVQRRSPDTNPRAILIRTARSWVLEHLDHQRPIEDLAQYLKLSPMSLHRLMVRETGMSPGRYFRELKMDHCREQLLRSQQSIKWIAYQMGYKHANDFSRAYREHFGVSPQDARAEA